MIQLPNSTIYVGGILDLHSTDKHAWAYVHATKTVYDKMLGLSGATPGQVPYIEENRLYLNWQDGSAELYACDGVNVFNKILDFVDLWSKTRKVLIHCDMGMSRGPTVGLVYAAKRLKIIPNTSFKAAQTEYLKLYPKYSPGGIGQFAAQNWDEIK